MNKLLINLTACAFGLVLSSTVIAADQMAPEKDSSPEAAQSDTQGAPSDNAGGMTADKSTPTDPQAAPNSKPASVAADKSTQTDPQAAPNSKPASVAADKANKPEDVSEAYTAALKKCTALTGTQKDTCEKQAKKEHGNM